MYFIQKMIHYHYGLLIWSVSHNIPNDVAELGSTIFDVWERIHGGHGAAGVQHILRERRYAKIRETCPLHLGE